MNTKLLFAILICAGLAFAKDRPSYLKGRLVSMDSVSCCYAENGGKSVASSIIGTDSENKKTEELLCQEYVLESEHLIYHIRPKNAKHPALLPLGEEANFRIRGDRMLLRVPEGDDKEREYRVISMALRPEPNDVASSSSLTKDQP